MAVEGSVPDLGAIVPHLVVRDADEAVDFYIRAFSAGCYTGLLPPAGPDNTFI